MRVDFYQLTRDPVEAVLPLIARNTLGAGQRLLVVSADDAQLGRIGEGLWSRLPDSFLAHGRADQAHAARQPILLSAEPEAANGARYIALADGQWRETATAFDRAFLLFDDNTIEAARGLWRELAGREGDERHFWRQDGGKWREVA